MKSASVPRVLSTGARDFESEDDQRVTQTQNVVVQAEPEPGAWSIPSETPERYPVTLIFISPNVARLAGN